MDVAPIINTFGLGKEYQFLKERLENGENQEKSDIATAQLKELNLQSKEPISILKVIKSL